MATFELFVGSNNDTHRVERERLETILASHVDGWTLTDTRGMWKGTAEDSVSVLLTIPKGDLPELLADIRVELSQEAVAWRKASPLHFAA